MVLFLLLWQKPSPKEILGEAVNFILNFQVTVHHLRKVKNSSQLLTSRPQTRSHRNDCINAYCSASCLYAYTVQGQTWKWLPGNTDFRLGLPTSIKAIRRLLQRHVHKAQVVFHRHVHR